MKKNIILSAIIASLFSFVGCTIKDYVEFERLDKTIFIEDPEAPGLPTYSELGYNTFGAYIERSAFYSTAFQLPSKIIVRNDTLSITLNGNSYSGTFRQLEFKLKGVVPKTYEELNGLNNKSINLEDASVSVYLTTNDTVVKLKIIEGDLTFKKVRRLVVDNNLGRVIVSGTFRIKALFKDTPITIKSGRFDLGFSDDNFYYFE